MGSLSTPAVLPLLMLAFVTTASAFLPSDQICHHWAATVSSQLGGDSDVSLRPKHQLHTSTDLQMSYKSPDEGNSYNDDAFGLIFLTGGVLSQDVDFVCTFAALSAIAAIGTNVGAFEKDERAPAIVALATLPIFPVVSSLRQSGSLENLAPPTPLELGLCLISAVWAFFNWSKAEKE